MLLFAWANSAIVLLNRFFSFTDLPFIAAVLLIFAGMPVSAFVFLTGCGFAADALFMPNTGYYLFSNAAAIAVGISLAVRLYTRNYITKVFILAAALFTREVLLSVSILVFYTGFKPQVFPYWIVLRFFLTVACGIFLVKIFDTDYGRLAKWLKMTLGKK